MKKALTICLLLCCVLAQILANGASEAPAKKAEEPVTLSVLWFNDGNESEIFTSTMDR